MSNISGHTQPASGFGGGFVSELDNAIRENPVSAALIGMGVLWMFFGGSKVASVAALLPGAAKNAASGIASSLGSGAQIAVDSVTTAASRAKDVGRSVGATVQSAVSDATSTARDALSATYDAATGAADRVADEASQIGVPVATAPSTVGSDALGIAGTMQSSLAQTFERQPLLLGAIGLAIGAGIGAALPGTEMEQEFVGDSASNLMKQAQDFAGHQMENLGSVAERALKEMKTEAEVQGLTPAAAKEALSGVGEKLKSVASSTRQNVTQKLG